jgi:hypothetical protein
MEAMYVECTAAGIQRQTGKLAPAGSDPGIILNSLISKPLSVISRHGINLALPSSRRIEHEICEKDSDAPDSLRPPRFRRALGVRLPAQTLPAAGSQDLIGLWESRTASKGGVGQAIELRENGLFVQSTIVMVGARYEVSGDHLTLRMESPEPSPPMESTFRVAGDRMVETAKGVPDKSKERVGKAAAGQPPIVGVWRSKDQLGLVGYEKYTPDGHMLFRLTMATTTGCYRIEGDHLRLSGTNGRKDPVLPFHHTSGELVVEDASGKPFTYLLAVDGPWYDRHPVQLPGTGMEGLPGVGTGAFPGDPDNGG